MPEEELEKRLRTLEIRGATLLGSITTLAACCLAFLGFEYYQIPSQIQKQVDGIIGEQTKTKIEEALVYADQLKSKILYIDSLNPQVKFYKHNDKVTPPPGTEKGDWVAFISPSVMGREEPDSESDNALLEFESSLSETDDGWTVVAHYKYKFGDGNPKWMNDDAKVYVLLIPKLDLQSSN